MRTIRLFCTTIAFTLFAIMTYAQPRLTVVVVVDGMTYEDLNTLSTYWQSGGLKQLYEEAYQTTARFNHQVYGGQETMATLMTGTSPYHHSIMADKYYDRSQQEDKIKTILYDNKVSGIGTTLHLSPQTLLATTLTDEWRMVYGSEAKIYAVGLNPYSTILMAGHTANACCWLDGSTYKWATTSYYPEGLPTAADEMNVGGKINHQLSGDWKPRMNISAYPIPIDAKSRQTFSFGKKANLLQTPIANSLVIEMALALQKQQKLGSDAAHDLLLLQLNTLSPDAESDMVTTTAQADLFLGINDDLGKMIKQLNMSIGRDHYQILLVGRPIKGYCTKTMKQYNMPIEYFNVDRAAALTAAYLMAIHGHERWIEGSHGPFIYLNRMLIEKKGLSLEMFQRQVANFIMEFEGVQVAYPIHEAIISDDNVSVFHKYAGDVYFKLLNNWILATNEVEIFDNVIQTNPVIPVLFWTNQMTYFPEQQMDVTEIKSLISPMK